MPPVKSAAVVEKQFQLIDEYDAAVLVDAPVEFGAYVAECGQKDMVLAGREMQGFVELEIEEQTLLHHSFRGQALQQ